MLLGWFMMLPGLQSPEGLTGAGGSGLAYSHGWQVHVGCWQDNSVFRHTEFTIGLLECPHNMAASFPHSDWFRREKEKARRKGRCLLWPNCGSYTPSFLQCPIGYTGQPYSMWEWTIQECDSQEAKIIVAVLETGCHKLICKKCSEEFSVHNTFYVTVCYYCCCCFWYIVSIAQYFLQLSWTLLLLAAELLHYTERDTQELKG